MAYRRQSPEYEIEEFFESTETEYHKAFAASARRRITGLLFEQSATTKQLARGFEVDPVPGERVYAFLGVWFPTDPNCPRKRAR